MISDTNNLQELPKSWVWTKFVDICSDYKEKGAEGTVPYLEIGDIDISSKGYALGIKSAVKGALVSRAGDVLVSRVRPTRGAVVITREDEMCVSSALTILKPILGTSSEYVYYFLAWNNQFFNFLGANSKGTMYPTVIEEFILQYPLPFAPFPEQNRIVAKIEELFTLLDAGVKALKKIKKLLKRYRQAVLKAAFEGKLTSEWREAHKSELEPASVLLEKIKTERAKNGKYKELPPLDTSSLSGLPEGWAWTTLPNIAEMNLGKMLDKEKNKGQPMKYLRNINVRWNHFDLSDLLEMKFKPDEIERYQIKLGDVVICEGGEPGRVAAWMFSDNIQYQKALHRVRPVGNIQPKWIVYHLWNDANSFHMERYFTGTTIKHLTGESLRRYPVRIASSQEQCATIEEIERCFSIADKVENTIEQSLKQSDRLRQSILKKAFEGKLVTQDSNDEPAEKLLERIKAEKAKQPKRGRVNANS